MSKELKGAVAWIVVNSPKAVMSLMCWLGVHVYVTQDICYYCGQQSWRSLEQDRDAAYDLIRDIGLWSAEGRDPKAILRNIKERHARIVAKADPQHLDGGFGQYYESAGS